MFKGLFLLLLWLFAIGSIPCARVISMAFLTSNELQSETKTCFVVNAKALNACRSIANHSTGERSLAGNLNSQTGRYLIWACQSLGAGEQPGKTPAPLNKRLHSALSRPFSSACRHRWGQPLSLYAWNATEPRRHTDSRLGSYQHASCPRHGLPQEYLQRLNNYHCIVFTLLQTTIFLFLKTMTYQTWKLQRKWYMVYHVYMPHVC